MIHKLSRGLLTAVFVMIGFCIGHAAWNFWDYTARPGLYAMQSAPWYTSSLVICGMAAILAALLLILRFALLRYEKSRKQQKDTEESRKK